MRKAITVLVASLLVAGTAGAQPSAGPAPQPEPESAAGDAASVRALDRVQNTWLGPAGGIQVPDATSGATSSLRLQLAIDAFSSSDFLLPGDEDDYFGGTLSLGFTVLSQLELYAALHSHANANDRDAPVLMQVLGDVLLGAKGNGELLPWLFAGGDLRLLFYNSIGDVGPALESTSLGLRGLLSADLRALPEQSLPLIARASAGYFFDNSAQLAEAIEDARYAALGEGRRSRAAEDRHLLRRVERFSLSVQRVDAFELGLGVEAPLHVHGQLFVHPLLEWDMAIPVNRQDYVCLLVANNDGPDDPDSCLGVEGIDAMPSSLTLGARVFPPVRGLSVLLGLELGLTGTSTFVRELPGNRPWAFLFALGYAPAMTADVQVQTREVVREVARAAPQGPRIEGLVVDQTTGVPVAFARIAYPGHAFTAQQTAEDGRFVSYQLLPGDEQVEVSHPDYETRLCSVTLPAPAGSGAAPAGGTAQGESAQSAELNTNPYFYANAQAAARSAVPPAEPGPPARVALRCELSPRPRLGSLSGQVVDSQGASIARAEVMLSGPSFRTVLSDAAGAFDLPSLEAGRYEARVSSDAHMLAVTSVDVPLGSAANLRVELVAKPKTSQVVLTAKEIRIKQQVFFRPNSAEISERSTALLLEIADVLLRNPQVERVEIQGHTDNRGDSQKNLTLSQSRAEAVRERLVAVGVAEGRLTAKGYGDTRPLVPNLTDKNRARNRRVQLVIE